MKMVIVGTGALARLYAFQFRNLGPILIGRSPVPSYVVEGFDTAVTVHPAQLSWNESPPADCDVVLMALKWPAMELAQTWLARNARNALVISVMNGMGQEEALDGIVDGSRLAVGVTTAAATRIDGARPGVAVHSLGTTWLPQTGHRAESDLKSYVQTHNLPWAWHSRQTIREKRWQKLLFNAVINPLSALADCPNGELPQHLIWRLSVPLLSEAKAVAEKENIPLPENLSDMLLALTRATGPNISSMLQDMRRGVATEITAITGYLVKRAKSHSLSVPTHEAIYTLIRMLEPPEVREKKP